MYFNKIAMSNDVTVPLTQSKTKHQDTEGKTKQTTTTKKLNIK